MKKISRAIAGGGHHSSRDGQSGRRNLSSQGSKNTDGQQSGGATAATGGPQSRPTGGGNGSRGGYQLPGVGLKKGGGSKDQEITDHDLPVLPANMKFTVSSQPRSNKIEVTTTKPKAEVPGVAKMVGPPSDKDLKLAIDSLVGDPQERRDSKGDVEYYREQYRMLKSENESLRDRVDELGEMVESAKTRVRVKNETIAKYIDAVNEKDKELSKLQKSLQKAQSKEEGTSEQLAALQKRYISLSEDKDKLEAEMTTLDQSCKVKVADLERRLSDTTKELLHFNKHLQKLQDDDVPSSIKEEEITKLEEKLEASEVALQEETNKVKRRDEQVANMTTTNKHLITELNRVKQTMKEIKNCKQSLEVECQQLKDKVATLQEYNKQSDGVISNQKAEVKKMENFVSELKENEASKVALQKKREEILLQIHGVGDSSDDGKCDPDDPKTIVNMSKLTVEFKEITETALMAYCNKLTQEIKNQEEKTAKTYQRQLLESQDKVDELTKELAVEKSATENAKSEMDKLMNQLQQLQHDKRILEQQMNDGYKEREDRIAELEEFINDNVAELDSMERAMKQTVTNKQILEKDYQKLHEYYNAAKKTAEQYESRNIVQEEKISQLEYAGRRNIEKANSKIESLEQEKQALIQSNQNMSREVARLMDVDQKLQDRLKEIEKFKLELRKAEEELQTKEFMLKTYREDFEQERKDRENAHIIKQQEIRKMKIEMENFEAECQGKVHDIQQALLQEHKEMSKVKDQLKLLETERNAQEQQMNALQAQLEKALDPLENIEELKELVDLGEEIGRGAYGLVKKVSLHGTVCAAKDVHAILINYASNRELERIKKSFLEECVRCSKLFHPNLVQFLGIHYPSKQAKLPWLVMELLDCSLTGFLNKYDKENVPLFVKASILYDISLGLQFLHGRDIIHRDLSSNNILLTKYLTAKITDLGVAKLVDPDGSKSHTVAPGTQHFLPPEVFSEAAKSHYGKSIDVFSLGCIMIHVTAHKWPTPLPLTYYDPKLKKRVALSEVERRAAYLSEIQGLPELKVLIENCLHDDSELRPNATTMVDDLGRLKLSYQKNSNFVGEEMNAVVYEKNLKLLEKRLSEQALEREKLNKTLQDHLICHKCNRQFKDGQLQEYRRHVDKCCQ